MTFGPQQWRAKPARPRSGILLGLLALVASAAGPASAQDLSCDGVLDAPCGYELDHIRVQQAPTVFNFQARIAQSKLPQGQDASFPVVVRLVHDGAVLCQESCQEVKVTGGVLNLSIGRHISCALEEVLAENANLDFQVCIGGVANCLKPIALASQPYALKATYASDAVRADYADLAGQANYAHRATADRQMYLRKELGAGYFDFYTHAAPDATAIYDEEAYKPYAESGFIQWTSVRQPARRSLHVAGMTADSGQLAMLDLVVIGAKTLRMLGDLFIDPGSEPGTALAIHGAGLGLDVHGDSRVVGSIEVAGKTDASELFRITGDLLSEAGLALAVGMTVSAGGLSAAAGLHAIGSLVLQDGLTTDGALTVTGDATISGGGLATNAVAVGDTLNVQGAATFDTVAATTVETSVPLVSPTLAVAEGATLQGDLHVTGAMQVTGPVVIQGTVMLNGGTVNAGGDMRYVQASGEVRDLTWGGDVTFQDRLVAAGGLDADFHRVNQVAMQVSAGPPVPCTADLDGLFYLDTQAQAMMLCSAGAYRALGQPRCGNGYVEPGEACDDNNVANDDGCAAACTVEAGWSCVGPSVQPTTCQPICHDGLIRGAEACDDGAGKEPDGDGCARDCTQVETGWTCAGEPTLCEPVCHDGLVRPGEGCDDGPGNEAAGDGCAPDCTKEDNYTCTDEPSDCQPWVCGDGVRQGPEGCDDGNNTDGDGCDGVLCQVEPGWQCENFPDQASLCDGLCGDGQIIGAEVCDDGNTNNGDGCDATCHLIESNSTCIGEPSICIVHGSWNRHGPSYSFNCATSSFVVPAHVTTITVQVYGADGTGCGLYPNSIGGAGQSMSATVSVIPGETLLVQAGGVGLAGGSDPQGYMYYGGACGGGNGAGVYDSSTCGGAGGGYSAIFRGSVAQSGVLVIVGGGGGGHYQGIPTVGRGGDGGDPTGKDGHGVAGYGGSPGRGGTQYSGGAAGGGHCAGSSSSVQQQTAPTAGGALQGGRGGRSYGGDLNCLGRVNSGGGGGGYYGGGGGGGQTFGYNTGAGAGGGGGSSYAKPGAVTNVQYLGSNPAGGWTGRKGFVKIDW